MLSHPYPLLMPAGPCLSYPSEMLLRQTPEGPLSLHAPRRAVRPAIRSAVRPAIRWAVRPAIRWAVGPPHPAPHRGRARTPQSSAWHLQLLLRLRLGSARFHYAPRKSVTVAEA